MKRLYPLLAILLLAYCSSDDGEVTPDPVYTFKEGCTVPLSENYDPEAQVDNGTCKPVTCEQCTYVIPANKVIIDGDELNFEPGDVICLNSATSYLNLNFKNIVGTEENPIVIVNCGGVATLNASGKGYGIKTEASKYFKIIGVGSDGSPYGIKVKGAQQGMQLIALSTNFEVSGLEIYDAGFAGIMAKTDPTCDDATIRGNFVMRNISIHHNYIHDTGGEGLYIGNSFYASGVDVSGCGNRLPHEIRGVKIFYNVVRNSGWDAIQLGCATQGAEVYNNTVENFGVLKKSAQWSGIQLGEGTGGFCYNNLIREGEGQGIIALGLGHATIYNNLIVEAGKQGIFADLRGDGPFGPGYKILNNTIVSPVGDAINIYASKVTDKNVIINNLLVDPGTYGNYGSNTGKAFINNGSPGDITNNYYAENNSLAKFKNAAVGDYRILENSPARDAGRDVSAFGVTKDFMGTARPNGSAFDIGAFEF
jgi:Right handed beta helix region